MIVKPLTRWLARSRNRLSGAGRCVRPCGSILLGIALVLVFAPTLQACPLCGDAVENQVGSNAAGVMTGFFWSILFMMAMPYVLFGGFTALVVRAHRQAADEKPTREELGIRPHSSVYERPADG